MTLHICISHHEGDLEELLGCTNTHPMTIYNKSGQSLKSGPNRVCIPIKNYGYNLAAYLLFIIDNYENLPERIAFIKGNIIPRHISKAFFMKSIRRKESFIPLADQRNWHGIRWPQAFSSGDNMLYEVNNSWYRFKHQRSYFSNFNEFYNVFFDATATGLPRYVRFAPGANYVVSRKRILRCSQWFYRNLLDILRATPLACECHYLERALGMIWDSRIPLAQQANSGPLDLERLAQQCRQATREDHQLLHQARSALLKAGGWLAATSLQA